MANPNIPTRGVRLDIEGYNEQNLAKLKNIVATMAVDYIKSNKNKD